MILVDSSVWIEYFGPGNTPVCDQLDDFVTDGETIAVAGVIVQEVLQGTRSEREMERLEYLLKMQHMLYPADPMQTHIAAARLYRRCRRAGVTPRSGVDCLIAQLAIESNAALFHADRDFSRMGQVLRELTLI